MLLWIFMALFIVISGLVILVICLWTELMETRENLAKAERWKKALERQGRLHK